MLRVVLVMCSFALLSSSPLAAQSAVGNPPAADLADRVHAVLQAAHERGIFHGSALIAEGGEVVYEGSFGTADAAGRVPLTAAHRFMIGSVEKEFSAVGLMVLLEEGVIELDDPISRFLPSLPEWADRVRVRDILMHTSGLPQVRYQQVSRDADIYADLKSLERLQFQPGTDYFYNNNDIFLRFRVLEVASGLSYPDFVQARLLDPCGMKTAVIDPGPDDQQFTESFDNEHVLDTWRSPMSGHVSVAPRDLYAWARCLSDGELISEASLLELTRSFEDNGRPPLGQVAVEDGELLWHAHIGQMASYEALLYVNRVEDVVMVMLTNSKQQQLGSLAGAVGQAMQGVAYELPKKSMEMAFRARILHQGFAAGMELLEQIERDGGERFDLSQIEEDLTEAGEYLLEMGRAVDAVRVYGYAAERFPESDVARDGLAEARRAASR